MEGLRSSNEIRQAEAASELAEMLLLGNEESLPNLPVKDIVHALIALLQKEHNFELVSFLLYFHFFSFSCICLPKREILAPETFTRRNRMGKAFPRLFIDFSEEIAVLFIVVDSRVDSFSRWHFFWQQFLSCFALPILDALLLWIDGNCLTVLFEEIIKLQKKISWTKMKNESSNVLWEVELSGSTNLLDFSILAAWGLFHWKHWWF